MLKSDKNIDPITIDYENHLWNVFKSGDEEAYATIYNQYIGTLYAYGKKLNSGTSTVEDAIQDVFVDLWRYKHNLGTIRSIRAYLISCLRRQLNKIAKRDRVLLLEEEGFLEDHFEFENSAQDLLIHAQDKQAEVDKVKKALKVLTRRQKEIIYLRYFQNLSYQEISHIMGLNQRSTYNLLSKALHLLKERLAMVLFVFFV